MEKSPMIVENVKGNYGFIRGGGPFSSGCIARPGFEVVHAAIRPFVSLARGFELVERHLKEVERPIDTLCAMELRIPQPLTMRGFEEFMNRVDRDRLRTMPPDTFEKYLPFAMALGVEERWAQAFAGIVRDPPTWYVGSDPSTFNALSFSHSLSSMSARAGETFASAPRSSSSGSGFSSGGGSSGGGSSGGGFGGGGGSAF